ncbi:MAG: hypothetical protein JSS82_03220 [Bacteroidetes bacterium]|nr:hypothetical protein [Bacteroidota bacterium]
MRHLFVLFLLGFSFRACAQTEYQDWGQAYGFKAGDKRYIYADTANIRASPNQFAEVQYRLPAGSEVSIISIGGAQIINGKNAPWCLVSYTANGTSQTGYLWSGLMAPRELKKDGVLFLYGMRFSSIEPSGPTLVDIKAMRGDSVIARCSFNVDVLQTAEGVHEAKLLSSKGLKGIDCILYFSYSGQACAVPTIEQYIAWDGQKFITLPQIYSEADAGAYTVEQKYTFPADKGGRPNEIRMREVIDQYGDDGDKVTSHRVKTRRYRWDAASHVLRKL